MNYNDSAVICRQLTKEFGSGENKVPVLRGIDLEIPFGEMTLLVGPSGCGKTTLLSVVAGLLNRGSGDLEVLGHDWDAFSSREAVLFRRANLGFVVEQSHLLPAASA